MEGIEEQKKLEQSISGSHMKMHLIRQVDVKGNHGGIKGLVNGQSPEDSSAF